MELKKNPEADLEKRRVPLVLMGLCTAVALSLLAFEMKSYDDAVSDLGEYLGDNIEDEIIPVTFQQPPPPPPPKPPETQVLEIVEDEEEVEEELEMDDMEVDEETEIEIIEEEVEEVVEDEIFTIVEKMPEFPGGETALMKFVQQNVKYPTLAKESGISGIVYVTFVVEKNGAVSGVKVLRGIGGGCDEEAVRVMKSMPKWSPGQQRGKSVKVQYNMPVRFMLQ